MPAMQDKKPVAAAPNLAELALLRRVRDRIDREYEQPLDVEALAWGVRMSGGHLSRQFKLAYGESVYAYLMTRRIERAMALLRRGDLSVTEVCFAVGCSSLGTFSTRFTELVGVSPSVYRRQSAQATAGLPACVSKQVSRPIRNREASPKSPPRLTVIPSPLHEFDDMNIRIHSTFLPHSDPEASLAFYRDILGFEVRNDVAYGGMRWITVSPPGQPATSIVLAPPGAAPGVTEDERRTITEMMAKGTYAMLLLATTDLDATFGRLQASEAEIVQEPTEQPYGVRDCGVRDPAGNMIRIQQIR